MCCVSALCVVPLILIIVLFLLSSSFTFLLSFFIHFSPTPPCVPPPSQPQKVERAEEPDVFSPPIRFSHRIAWLHCESFLESDEKQQ